MLTTGCSCSTGTAVFRAELGMHPLRRNREVKNMKMQYNVKSVPKRRLPAMADEAVGEKVKGEPGGIA